MIIPNLYRWPANVLLIDPKGETMTALKYRRDVLGQEVHVIDPMKRSKWPAYAAFNPLKTLDPDRLTIAEDIGVIVNAMVIRSDPKALYWDTGAAALLSGLIAYLIIHKPEIASLPALKSLLNKAGMAGGEFDQALTTMRGDNRCAGLMQAAASRLDIGGNDAQSFLATADTNTAWINSYAFAESLSESTFDLDDIRKKPCTICIVPDPEYLTESSRFLRMFVELAIKRMARYSDGRDCLFILDEFANLGYLEMVEKSAGLMPGFGVKLWPFIQDLGPLQKNYPTSWRSFFGNASLKMFFGCTEETDLGYIRQLIGDVRDQTFFESTDKAETITSAMIRHHIRKSEGDIVARRMLCFVPGHEPGISLKMRPYFRTREYGAWPAKAEIDESAIENLSTEKAGHRSES